jgi:enamine deaminase RidA (YjgF/YER057c/UK114 family)
MINPESLGAPKGYNNGMLAPAGGRVLFVAGQVAMDAEGRVIDGDMAAQWERALENVLAVVRAAGGGPADIGRMTVFVTDKARRTWRRARRWARCGGGSWGPTTRP